MRYEKPQIEVVQFDYDAFIRCSNDGPHDDPIGSFTCGTYSHGGTCVNISWYSSGYTCGSYTNGNCSAVTSPPGSMGDGCPAWRLTCSKF